MRSAVCHVSAVLFCPGRIDIVKCVMFTVAAAFIKLCHVGMEPVLSRLPSTPATVSEKWLWFAPEKYTTTMYIYNILFCSRQSCCRELTTATDLWSAFCLNVSEMIQQPLNYSQQSTPSTEVAYSMFMFPLHVFLVKSKHWLIILEKAGNRTSLMFRAGYWENVWAPSDEKTSQIAPSQNLFCNISKCIN